MTSTPSQPPPSPSFELSALDRWVRRTTVATLIALAVGLVGLGVALYPPVADSAAPLPEDSSPQGATKR